jgi:histidyl-tRNA synthetase
MTARFGAPSLPMCGFSIGFERVCQLVDPSVFGPGRRKVAILCAGEEEMLRCLELARDARAASSDAIFSVLRRARNVRRQQDDLQRLSYSEFVDGQDFSA